MQTSLADRGAVSRTWSDGCSAAAIGAQRSREVDFYLSPNREQVVLVDGWLEFGTTRTRGADRARSTSAYDFAAAYEERGDGCLGDIRGEFAIALITRTSVMLVRDATGRRPLFFSQRGGTTTFASELGALATATDDRPLRPNRGMVADFISGWMTRRDETFFESFCRVRPGYCVELRPDIEPRVWAWHPLARGETRESDSPVQELRHALALGVARDVKADANAALLLSGGIDSTAVLAAFEDARAYTGRGASDLKIVSCVFGRMPSCNERPLIEATAHDWGLQPKFLRSDDYWSMRNEAEAPAIRRQEPLRGQLLDQFEVAQLAAVRAAGADVVVTGYGGDEALTGSIWTVADHVRNNRNDRASRELTSLDPGWRELAQRAANEGPAVRPWLVRDEVDGALPAALEILHRDRIAASDQPDCDDFDSLARWDAFCRATSFESMALAETTRAVSLSQGLELVSPFFDPDVIAAALSASPDLRRRNGHAKGLAVELLTGRVPSAVLELRTKSTLNALVDFGLRFRERDTIKACVVAEHAAETGLLTPGYSGELYRRYCKDPNRFRAAFLRVLSLELWAGHWFGG